MSREEILARARHDLGKYVHFEARWLAESASEADLREALAADLLRTRRGPGGTQSAATTWAELRAGLVAEAPDVALEGVDAGVRELAEAAARLESMELAELRELAERARQVADAVRGLGRN
jgi:hypothetical protein